MRYVVLDTNVLLSALLCRKRSSSVPLQILQYVFARKLLPVFNHDILDEYEEALHRSKFRFSESFRSKSFHLLQWKRGYVEYLF